MDVEPGGGGAAAHDLSGEGLGAGGVAALGGVADLFVDIYLFDFFLSRGSRLSFSVLSPRGRTESMPEKKKNKSQSEALTFFCANFSSLERSRICRSMPLCSLRSSDCHFRTRSLGSAGFLKWSKTDVTLLNIWTSAIVFFRAVSFLFLLFSRPSFCEQG